MQISNKNQPVKIGVISLWGLALFIILFILYIIGTNQKLFTPKYSLFMFVTNVQGLNSGAFITLSGLKVGVVGDLKFAKQDGQQGILVELKVSRDYANMITTSSVAAINTMGILGDKYVDISLGNLTDPVLNEGMLIKTAPTLEVSAIVGSATGAIQEFQKTLATINKVAEQALNGSGVLGMLIQDKTTRHNLARLIYSLNRISSQIEQGRGNVGQLMQDTTVFASLKNTATNLDIITSRIQNGEGSLGRMVADTAFYARLNSIAALTDSLLYNLQAGNGTAGQLLHDRQLYEQLQVLTRSLIELTTDIKNNPKKYVTIKVF